MTVTTETRPERATLPEPCQARADAMADLAARAHITAQPWPGGYTRAHMLESMATRTAWNAHAAGEYPRPTLQDAADIAARVSELAAEAWHYAAGATILGGYCCGTPASHRDALVGMARRLRTMAAESHETA